MSLNEIRHMPKISRVNGNRWAENIYKGKGEYTCMMEINRGVAKGGLCAR